MTLFKLIWMSLSIILNYHSLFKTWLHHHRCEIERYCIQRTFSLGPNENFQTNWTTWKLGPEMDAFIPLLLLFFPSWRHIRLIFTIEFSLINIIWDLNVDVNEPNNCCQQYCRKESVSLFVADTLVLVQRCACINCKLCCSYSCWISWLFSENLL